jgi:hypothetical protein
MNEQLESLSYEIRLLELEEKNKEEIDNLKTKYNSILLNKCLTKIKNDIKSSNIEKELEEKNKDVIDYIKENHDFNLLDKMFTTTKK